MAQNYLWKVEYKYEYAWELSYGSEIFTNKISALKFMNRLENDSHYSNVTLIKWFGNR